MPVLNVPVTAKSLSNSKAVPGSESSELLSTVPPSFNVPPVESSNEFVWSVSEPCRFKSASPVCKVTELRVCGSSSFKSEVALPRVRVLVLCTNVLNVFSPLKVSVTSSSKCRILVSFVVRVPFSAERSAFNFSVLPLTSKVVLFANVPPWVSVIVPPLELIVPALSCNS